MQNFISVSTIFCKIICKFIEITLMQVCGWVWWWTKALSEISPLINCSNNIQISSLNIHSVCINPCTSSKRPSLASSFSLKIRWVSPNLWVGCWRWGASLPLLQIVFTVFWHSILRRFIISWKRKLATLMHQQKRWQSVFVFNSKRPLLGWRKSSSHSPSSPSKS